MKTTKKLNEVFPIPLMPYSHYIKENMRQNDELMAKTTGSPIETMKRANWLTRLGVDYKKSKVQYLL